MSPKIIILNGYYLYTVIKMNGWVWWSFVTREEVYKGVKLYPACPLVLMEI